MVLKEMNGFRLEEGMGEFREVVGWEMIWRKCGGWFGVGWVWDIEWGFLMIHFL